MVKMDKPADLGLFIPYDTANPSSYESRIPFEPYFTDLDLMKPLSGTVDEKRAKRLRKSGAAGLASQIGNKRQAEIDDMRSRFISSDHVKYEAFEYGAHVHHSHPLEEFRVRNDPKDVPPTDFDDVIDAILNARNLFPYGITVSTVMRKGCDEYEYALFGVDEYQEHYLLARWGTEMPHMQTLMNARDARQAELDIKVLEEARKE